MGTLYCFPQRLPILHCVASQLVTCDYCYYLLTTTSLRSLQLHITACVAGGGKRDRTADLLHAMQALSQLSYTPVAKKRDYAVFIFIVQVLFYEKPDFFINNFSDVSKQRHDQTIPARRRSLASAVDQQQSDAKASPATASSNHALPVLP